ncbi:PREDICTED: uncharacterized protein LOC108770270 [Trachymyrmex cornetzi]|uniref:uncharacterized protein LOC108770270 n=1 Tax=Trachymyrmex cornetzi TaxID=471704 RepID=UPI00084F19F5|nr:PREDICTED: uncharacterized protein LOC108770270 [Trachymyrmex cornetzi]
MTGGDPMPSISMEDSGDLSSSFDQVPKKGKKRGRKPKGSNCPGAHAMSKISSKRLDYEDDEWDRTDFFKISKRAGHGLKKRKGLVKCQLDDRLSSCQKDAIEEVTALFPQMSPKSVMAETLRVLETAGEAERRTQSIKGDLRRQIKVGVNVAKIAVQRLVSEISRSTEPTDEIRANNLALEREVIKLRREVDNLRRERGAMREQINELQCTVQELKERNKERDRGRSHIPSSDEEACDVGSLIGTRGRNRGERSARSGGVGADVVESLPPAYRPPIGGVRKRLEDRPSQPKSVSETGQIVLGEKGRSVMNNRGDSYAERVRNGMTRDNGGAGLESGRGPETSPPPMDYPVNGETWMEARTKRARKRIRKREQKRAAPDASVVRGGKDPGRADAPPPSCDENKDRPGGVTYAEVVRLARSKISLDDLSITNTRIRKAQAGGLLIEIPGGDEAGTKAEALVDKLKGVLAESEFKEEVKVVRPMRRAEMRLVDIDQSVTAEEVAEAVARSGQVQTADIRVGPLRPGRGGLNAAWVQCPLSCANKILGEGRLRVGWTMAGVVPLAKRRLQCFRCFAVGHTRNNCLSQVDRSTWCFQCGSGDGHRAAACRKPPKCPVCAGRGLPSGHRAGASECVPYNGPGQKTNEEDTRVTTAAGQADGADRGALAPGEGTRDGEAMETCDG